MLICCVEHLYLTLLLHTSLLIQSGLKGKKLHDICKPYVNHDIKTIIKKKHRLERKKNKYQITYGAEYRCLKNRVKKLMEKAKKSYYTNKV